MSWTFNSMSFEWGRIDQGGAPMVMAWKQMPRLVKKPLLGLKSTDIARVGYESATVSGPIYIADQTTALALRALNGSAGTLSDGTTNWPAVIEIDIVQFVGATDYTGTATFTRTRG